MSTYNFSIEGRVVKTTMVSTPQTLKPALEELLSSIGKGEDIKRIVSLDTETTHDHYTTKVVLLKLSTATNCLLIQLHRFPTVPSSLHAFLHLPDVSFVGVGIKFCLDSLESASRLRCRNAVDLGSLAAKVTGNESFGAFGLVDLARGVCFIEAAVKSHVMAFGDWGGATLSREQVKAATFDAHLAFLVGNRLLGGSSGSVSVYGWV